MAPPAAPWWWRWEWEWKGVALPIITDGVAPTPTPTPAAGRRGVPAREANALWGMLLLALVVLTPGRGVASDGGGIA